MCHSHWLSQATDSRSTARFVHKAHSTAASQHSPIPPSTASPEQRTHPQQQWDVHPHPPQHPPKCDAGMSRSTTCAWPRGCSSLRYSPGAAAWAWDPYEPGFLMSLVYEPGCRGEQPRSWCGEGRVYKAPRGLACPGLAANQSEPPEPNSPCANSARLTSENSV